MLSNTLTWHRNVYRQVRATVREMRDMEREHLPWRYEGVAIRDASLPSLVSQALYSSDNDETMAEIHLPSKPEESTPLPRKDSAEVLQENSTPISQADVPPPSPSARKRVVFQDIMEGGRRCM